MDIYSIDDFEREAFEVPADAVEGPTLADVEAVENFEPEPDFQQAAMQGAFFLSLLIDTWAGRVGVSKVEDHEREGIAEGLEGIYRLHPRLASGGRLMIYGQAVGAIGMVYYVRAQELKEAREERTRSKVVPIKPAPAQSDQPETPPTFTPSAD